MTASEERSADEPTSGGSVLTRGLVLLMATATGLAVANNYYAQPLLAAIRGDLGLSGAVAGLVVTLSQLGYAIGLVLLLPLGDLVERRRLITLLGTGVAVGLAVLGSAPSAAVLLPAAVVVGALSVQAQVLVPLAASMASDAERGRVVGTVMSGLLIGVLLARTLAGWLAETGTWRVVYYVAAGLMLVQVLALRRGLPREHEHAGLSYGRLLASTWSLLREESLLRRRALYGGLAFGGFSVLWTSMAFLLAGPRYGYSVGIIGTFGLVGAAGAAMASAAGRLADRGVDRVTTWTGAVALAGSWLLVYLGGRHLAALVVGILVLDAAVQGVHVTNQSLIYTIRPEARGRITSVYMTSYFAGGAAGSALSAVAWDLAGWTAVSLVGAAFAAALVLAVAVGEGRSGSGAQPGRSATVTG